MRIRTLCAVPLTFTLLSCSDRGIEPELGQSIVNLIPLAPGNKWNFSRSYIDTLGNITQTITDSLYFVGDTTTDGVKWTYRFQSNIRLGYRNSPSGVMIRLLTETTTPGEYLRYPCFGNLGHKYPYPDYWSAGSNAWMGDTTWTIQLVSTDAVVTVPAGTFHCYLYRIEEVRSPAVGYTEEFISPDHGWIRIIAYSRRTSGGNLFPVNIRDLQTLSLK